MGWRETDGYRKEIVYVERDSSGQKEHGRDRWRGNL